MKHKKGCLQPELNIIQEMDGGHFIYLADAPTSGMNQVYYCPTCGVKLEEENE